MTVLVTCKNEEDPIKNVGAIVFIRLNSHFPNAQGQVTLQSIVESRRHDFEIIRDLMAVLVPCKNKK